MELVEDLKHRARLLHREAKRAEPRALASLRRLDELAQLSDGALARSVRRRHCLAALSRTLGFRGWPHAKAVLSGGDHPDRGELMHRDSMGALTNIWSASYSEAKSIRAKHGGFLLGYRHQFLVVEAGYIEHLGLEPSHPDWALIGRDWVRPKNRPAWIRLTRAAIDARLSS